MTNDLDPAVAAYLDGRAGGSTPLGLPYPSPSDPVYQGAAAIQALAQAVDAFLVPPGWMAYTDTAQANINTAAWTKLNATVLEESGGSGLAYTNGGIKVLTAGLYDLSATVVWGTSTAAGTRFIGIGDQGGSAPYAFTKMSAGYHAAGNGFTDSTTWKNIRLAVNTVVALWVYQSTGAVFPAANRRLAVHRTQK
jgi:hypothetical protein